MNMKMERENLKDDFIYSLSTRFFLDFELILLNGLFFPFGRSRFDPFSPGVGDIAQPDADEI